MQEHLQSVKERDLPFLDVQGIITADHFMHLSYQASVSHGRMMRCSLEGQPRRNQPHEAGTEEIENSDS